MNKKLGSLFMISLLLLCSVSSVTAVESDHEVDHDSDHYWNKNDQILKQIDLLKKKDNFTDFDTEIIDLSRWISGPTAIRLAVSIGAHVCYAGMAGIVGYSGYAPIFGNDNGGTGDTGDDNSKSGNLISSTNVINTIVDAAAGIETENLIKGNPGGNVKTQEDTEKTYTLTELDEKVKEAKEQLELAREKHNSTINIIAKRYQGSLMKNEKQGMALVEADPDWKKVKQQEIICYQCEQNLIKWTELRDKKLRDSWSYSEKLEKVDNLKKTKAKYKEASENLTKKLEKIDKEIKELNVEINSGKLDDKTKQEKLSKLCRLRINSAYFSGENQWLDTLMYETVWEIQELEQSVPKEVRDEYKNMKKKQKDSQKLQEKIDKGMAELDKAFKKYEEDNPEAAARVNKELADEKRVEEEITTSKSNSVNEEVPNEKDMLILEKQV